MPRFPLPQRLALLALPLVLAAALGCKKEFDTPPVRTLGTGNVVTIAQLKAMYQGVPKHFPDTAGAVNSVYAVVTADEQNGNLYKNIYVQDQTGALCLRLLNSGGLYQGDSIRIFLPGTVLSPYAGLMQLDSVSADNNVVKQATGVNVTPTPVGSITALTSQINGSLQGKLIVLNNVQFVDSTGNLTYADPVGQTTINRPIKDCSSSSTVDVRTSGYANFAGQHLPTGKGSFIGIASSFNGSPQLFIRNINEVQMNGPRCGAAANCTPVNSLTEDFSAVTNNAAIALPCWSNTFTQGSVAWRGRVSGTDYSAEARISLGQASTMWLVTPKLNFTGQSLSFSSAKQNWVHNALSVWVSTNFTGDANAATWTQVTGGTLAGQADADNTWVPSGSIALTGFLPSGYSGTFVVAFKYQGDATNSTTYRVDNVQIN